MSHTSQDRRTPGELAKCSPSARARNAAISPRVTFWFGQKLPLPQPLVIPDAASASIARKYWELAGTSPNVGVAGAGLICSLYPM